MKDPADRFVEAARRHGQPESQMSKRGTVDYRELWGSPAAQTQADEAPEWASDLRLVAAESPDDLIQAMYPGAKPYRCTLVVDGVRCEATEQLVAHHRVPLHKGGSFDPAGGVTLCEPHHREVDSYAR
jgi:hypothetical protein